MEVFWLLLVLVALILIAVWTNILGFSARTLRNRKLYRAIPMTKSFPCHWLLGHVPSLLKRNEAFWKRVEELNTAGAEHPGITMIYIGPLAYVTIVHPKYVSLFLKEPKSRGYDVLLPWLGEGLLIAEGNKWFRNRRLLTPAFHYSILKNYMSIYNSCVSKLITKWHRSAKMGDSVQVFQNLSSMSFDIILQCAFSFKSNCQEEKTQHPYVQACTGLVKHCSDRFLTPLYRISWIYWHTSHGKQMKKLCNIVHHHAEMVISERKVVLASKGEEAFMEDDLSNDKTKHFDFLDTLLLARDDEGKGMSDLEIRNEVDTFMFEGHDTTTSAMSWTLYCLAQHPQHQDKIREEVRSVLKGREWLEYEDLKHLNYTMWCIKEAMRLYPPVFSFARKTTKEISLGEYVVPEGAAVVIVTYLIHRNPAVWENPMEYNPLRFQPSNMEKHGPYDYIPFSAGIRNCIGQNFAMNEMKVVIARIITHFQMRLDPDHSVDVMTTIILRAKNDIKLVLEPLV